MTSMKRISVGLALALIVATSATNAMAHVDAPHPDTLKAAHGGQFVVAGSYSYELVVARDSKDGKESPVVVYVTDHAGQKVPTAGAIGSATILAGKLKVSATLQPDGDNRMKGLANYAAMPDMKVVVSIALSGKPPEQTRFTPMAVASDGHTDHKH